MTTSSYERLSHAKWDGKYHVVCSPTGRKKALYGKSRSFLGPVLRELARQRGSTILEGHMVQDHVHMRIRIPPKYAVAEGIGSIKGKSAIAVARQFGGRQRNCNGERFWARGYAVSTVGFEAAQIRAYIKHQEQLDAQGSDESGEFSERDKCPWQPLGLLTTVKPPALRGRYDAKTVKTRPQVQAARLAIRRLQSALLCAPMARNAGIDAIGSTVKNTELSATRENCMTSPASGQCGVIGVVPPVRPR
jgi:putative transposase